MCVISVEKTDNKDEFLYGGQAVIEGVMMRGKENMAVAIRKPDKEILVHKEELNSIVKKYKFLNTPFIRGTFVLIDALRVGINALFVSAKESLGEEEAEKEFGRGAVAMTFIVAFAIGIGLFVILPTYLSSNITAWLSSILPSYLSDSVKSNYFVLNIIEGVMRIAFFLLYVVAISQMNDIKRIFQYHGAEHKVIYNYESGQELTVENAKKFSCRHPRCGTSFIIMVLIISILLHVLLGWPALWERILSRIVLLPLIAGIAYEMTRLAGKKNPLFRLLVLPGVWLQVLTTREPADDQLEVAIKALEEVIPQKQKELTAATANS